MSLNERMELNRFKIERRAKLVAKLVPIKVELNEDLGYYQAQLKDKILDVVSYGLTKAVAVGNLRVQLFNQLMNDPTLIDKFDIEPKQTPFK